MKYCKYCDQDKAESEFYRKGKGLQDRCKLCRAKYNQGHYRRDKAAYIARAMAQRLEATALLEDAKRVPCTDCGRSYPSYVMDFDHVRGRKEFNVSRGKALGSIRKLKEEIAKCDVVCANCHRERTHIRA